VLQRQVLQGRAGGGPARQASLLQRRGGGRRVLPPGRHGRHSQAVHYDAGLSGAVPEEGHRQQDAGPCLGYSGQGYDHLQYIFARAGEQRQCARVLQELRVRGRGDQGALLQADTAARRARAAEGSQRQQGVVIQIC